MKKLITTDLGGQPVYFKDFEFLQEQVRELAKTVFGHLDTSKVIVLNGCTVSVSTDGYTISVTEGWAFYANEFFYIPAHEVIGSSPNVAKWRIVETWDARGLKSFYEDTVGDKNVYLVRKLQLGFYAPVSEGVLFSTTVLPNRTTGWYNNYESSSSYLRILYSRKTSFNHLELIGSYENNGGSMNGTTIWTAPVGFRPFMKQILPIVGNNNNCIGALVLDTNGSLIYRASAGDLNSYYPAIIYMNHSFFLSLDNG